MTVIRNKYVITAIVILALPIALLLTNIVEVKADNAGFFFTVTIGNSLRTHKLVGGTDHFTTSATRDTVLVKGAASTDGYLVASLDTAATPVAMSAIAKTDTLIVLRAGSGTSGASYTWLRIRPLN
jgi:hypothetical protein